MSYLEKRILSGIISDFNIASDFCFQYDSKLFLDPENRVIAKSIIKYVSNYKSLPTKRAISEFVKDKDLVNLINKFWDNKVDFNPAEYKFDVDQLKEAYKKNEFLKLKDRVTEGDDPETVIKGIQLSINEMRDVDGHKVNLKKTLKEHNEDFKAGYKAKYDNPEVGVGILTGFSCIDFVTNGLRPDDLYLVCGISGSGKSIFLNNMAINMWLQKNTIDTPKDKFTKGNSILYVSLEMSFSDCYQRTMSALADVPAYHLRDARLTKPEALAVSKACNFIKEYPYEFSILDVPRGFSVGQLEVELQRVSSQFTPDVIFIDYMSLMENANDDAEDWLALGELAGKVHEFARTYKIPIVTAAQLNRVDPSKMKNGSHLGLHRIGRSALIATHCTLILQIDDEQIYKNDVDTFKYAIIKNRHGQDNISHTIQKNFAHSKIRDLPFSDSPESAYLEDIDISGALDHLRDDISDILKSW